MGKLYDRWLEKHDQLEERVDEIESYITNDLEPDVSIAESEVEEIEEEYEEVKKEFKRLHALMVKKKKALEIAETKLKAEKAKSDKAFAELQKWDEKEPDENS